MPPPQRDERPIVRITRDEFLTRYWDYSRGEHVSIMGPTGNGKTRLAMDLLAVTAHPKLPGVALVTKPRDATVDADRKRLGWRKVREWPPVPSPWHPAKPPGYVLWPRNYLRDHRRTNAHHADVFETALNDCYAKGNFIVFADEVYTLDDTLKLGPDLINIWTKGRSMGCGLWGATQKPSHVPLWFYSQATHLFLSFDPDKRARDRYREIGGMDPVLIERATSDLDEFEWVYIRLAGRRSTICIVGA